MFQAVLFDLDGVITDTAEFHYRAWKKLATEIGITIDRAFNESLKGVSREDSLTRILHHGGQAGKYGHYTEEAFAELCAQKNAHYLQMIQEITSKDIFPGILSLLQALQGAGIKIALASASKNGPILLNSMGITSYFDAIADPSKVLHSKPAPDIFLAAALGVQASPEMCVAIEDSIAGIQAIQASGALAVGVGKAEDLGADIALVAHTRELTFDLLREIWENSRRT